MPRKRQIKVSDQLFNPLISAEEAEEIKFDLFVKSREIKQISQSLEKISLLSEEEQREWINEHETILLDLMNSFMDDSILAMDGLQLDKESMDLSVELVSQLRDAMSSIQKMLSMDPFPIS